MKNNICKSIQKWLTVVLTLLLVMTTMTGFWFKQENVPQMRYEGEGFETWQDAVQAYVNAMFTGDFDKATQCFAIESVVENGSCEAYLNRIRCHNMVSGEWPIPERELSGPSMTLGRNKILSFISRIQQGFYMNMIGYPSEQMSTTLGLKDEEEIAAYMDLFDHRNFEDACAGYRIVGIYTKDDQVMRDHLEDALNKERIQEMADAFKADYGYADYKEVMVDVSTENRGVYMFLRAVEYHGKWYVFHNSLATAILGLYPDSGNIELYRS